MYTATFFVCYARGTGRKLDNNNLQTLSKAMFAQPKFKSQITDLLVFMATTVRVCVRARLLLTRPSVWFYGNHC